MKPASAQERPSSDREGDKKGGREGGRKGGRGLGEEEAAGRYEGEESIFSERANQTKNGEIKKMCSLFVLLTVKSSESHLMKCFFIFNKEVRKI